MTAPPPSCTRSCVAAGLLSAEPAAHEREGAVEVPDLTVLRHVRIRRLVESAYLQRLRVPQRPAHVIQALKGDVLIGVAGHYQARLMNLPVERLHRVRPQRPQDVTRLIQSGQAARLLQLPRQVRAEARRDPHETIDEPRRASATDHGLGDGAKVSKAITWLMRGQ